MQSGVIPGYGQSMQIDTQTGDNKNILQRDFTSQTGDVYVGFTLRTNTFDIGDFLQIYFNDDNGASETTSVSGGLRNQGSGGDNFYFARVGGFALANNQNTTFTHPDDTNVQVVLKFSNTAFAGGDYDRTDLWINQATEGTADAFKADVDSNTAALEKIHIRVFSFEGDETVYIDNLRIATTYGEALVTVVPEPSTYLVFTGLALCFGAAGWWRKRRKAPSRRLAAAHALGVVRPGRLESGLSWSYGLHPFAPFASVQYTALKGPCTVAMLANGDAAVRVLLSGCE